MECEGAGGVNERRVCFSATTTIYHVFTTVTAYTLTISGLTITNTSTESTSSLEDAFNKVIQVLDQMISMIYMFVCLFINLTFAMPLIWHKSENTTTE